MSQSSLSVPSSMLANGQENAPLPLICCPSCHIGHVLWYVSGTLDNLGRHFYKCDRQGPCGCTFRKRENRYLQYLSGRWGNIIATQAGAPVLTMLAQNQACMKNIFFLAVANLVAICLLLANAN